MDKPTKSELYKEVARLKECVAILEAELASCQQKLPKYNDRGAGRKSTINAWLVQRVDEMRAAGATYLDIQEQLDIGSGTVNRIINRPRDN